MAEVLFQLVICFIMIMHEISFNVVLRNKELRGALKK